MTGVLTSGGNELADRLSASVRATVLPVITEAELDGVRQYQAEDRFYEVVNGVLRGDLSLGALAASGPGSVSVLGWLPG